MDETRQLSLADALQITVMAAPQPAGYLDGLNDAQAQAVNAPRHQAVQVLAGAGTGKTELISRRFVKLVAEMQAEGIPRPDERILVVTFTEDAAVEMRSRISQRLTANGFEPLPPQAWISTFHKFASRLLRAHSLSLGLAPDFTILNPLKQQVLFNRVVDGVLAGDFADSTDILARFGLTDCRADILSAASLNAVCPEQVDDVLSVERLRGVISRIKSSGLSPAEFLAQSQRQITGLSETLKNLPVPHDPDSKNAVVNMQLKIDAWRSALSGWAQVGWDPVREIDETHEKPTASTYLKPLEPIARKYLAPRTYAPVTPDFSDWHAVTATELVLAQVIAAVYAVYQNALLTESACDFDDLINHSIRLLENSPALREEYQRLFEAIIVDEFQDSNGSQLKLLNLLIRPEQPNITVVGDAKQSIYSFRFAQPENMDLIFSSSPPKTVPLQINYRSRPPVLRVANHLTERMTGDARQALQACPAREPQLEPAVTWVNLGLEESGTTATGKASLQKEPIGPQKEREARFIAVEIARLVAEGACGFRDIAILVKSHAKAERIQAELLQLGIPAVRRKNMGFFQDPVIKDAMALLRLMLNLHDDAALVRILQGRLNQRQLRLLSDCKKSSGCKRLFEVLTRLDDQDICPELPAVVREALLGLASALLDARGMQSRPASALRLFLRLSETVGLIRPDTPEAVQTQQRLTLRAFEKLLHLFSQSRPIQPTLAEVIETLTQYRDDPNLELPVAEEQGDEDAVQLMTIHAAKGLEFPVVFVAAADQPDTRGADDSLLLFDPQYEGKRGFGFMLGKAGRQSTVKKELYKACWQKPRSRAEQQRLFYVALTRAQDRLYVVRSNHSPDWTHSQPYEHENPWLKSLTEQRESDAQYLSEHYWQADAEDLREQLASRQAP